MHKSNRFSARLYKSMGRRTLLQKQGLVDVQGNPISSTPKPPEPRVKNIKHNPTPAPKPPSFGEKIGDAASRVGEAVFDTAPRAAANIITGQGKKQKKYEGGLLGAVGSAAKTAGKAAKKELGSFRREQAGIGGGPAKLPQQSEADQSLFQQQTSRRRGSGLTAFDRRRTAEAFRSQPQPGKQSPQNVQAMKSFNPALASLLAVSAGFAASDAVVNAAGARGARSITDDQLRLFETMANKKRGRKLRKAHSPLPPIQGLVWDEGAKRWRKPENVGKTASEVQGKKRIRGSGLGETARTPGGTSAGKGYSTGRAARTATGDIGVAGGGVSRKPIKRRRRRS